LRYRSPLAEAQNRAEAQSALSWVKTIMEVGPEGLSVVDLPAFARWLAAKMAVPSELLRAPAVFPTGGEVDEAAVEQVAAALIPALEGGGIHAE
jgi:hypothetical protein